MIPSKAGRHMGPMVQDIYATFDVGPDKQHFAVVDEGGVNRDVFAEQKRKLMEAKKSLQEQIESQEQGQSYAWLEPFRKWILTAKKLSETAHAGSFEEK